MARQVSLLTFKPFENRTYACVCDIPETFYGPTQEPNASSKLTKEGARPQLVRRAGSEAKQYGGIELWAKEDMRAEEQEGR